MLKLVSNSGRWAVKDRSMIFGNVIWVNLEEVKSNKYILIDDDDNDLKVNLSEYLIDG